MKGPFQIREVEHEAPSGFSCKFFMPEPREVFRSRILIVSVSGACPRGSAGAPHGKFISAFTLHGLHAFQPDCLILDLRELEYQFGNSLGQVFADVSTHYDIYQKHEPSFPVLVVTSDKCRHAFLALTTPDMAPEPEWHFDSLDAAIAAGLIAGDQWVESL